MKQGIHPQYFNEAKVTCVCGNAFTTGATVAEIRVEICNKCHPYFTGEAKYVDTLGRVEKFQAKQQKAKEIKAKKVDTIKEWVALVADFNMNLLQCCAGSECVTTNASYLGICVNFRMYIWFHNFCY